MAVNVNKNNLGKYTVVEALDYRLILQKIILICQRGAEPKLISASKEYKIPAVVNLFYHHLHFRRRHYWPSMIRDMMSFLIFY